MTVTVSSPQRTSTPAYFSARQRVVILTFATPDDAAAFDTVGPYELVPGEGDTA